VKIVGVVSSTGGKLKVLDHAALSHLKSVPLDPQPHEALVADRRGEVYVTHTYRHGTYNAAGPAHHLITVLRSSDLTPLEEIALPAEAAPHGLVLDAEQNRLFVTVESDGGGLAIVDLNTRRCEVIKTGGRPHWCAFSFATNEVVLTCKENPWLVVVDTVTKAVRRLDWPSGSEGIEVSRDGRYMYVTQGTAGKAPYGLAKLDLTTGEIVAECANNAALVPVHMTTEGYLLTAEFDVRPPAEGRPAGVRPGHGYRLDPDTLDIQADWPIGRGGISITSDSDGRGYFSALTDGTVTVVDLLQGSIIDQVTVDAGDGGPNQGAHGIVICGHPYAPGQEPGDRVRA